jgi:pimeloyl-ACP methyl ester carboxylesterase
VERWVKVEGHRLRYLYGGTGPPLLLIHGLMGFSFSWSENLSELSRHFTVFAPDLLNLGYSGRCCVDASLAGVARQVFVFMDTVGVKKAAVIGTSHGGGVTMKMALMQPSRLERMLLVDAANPWSERSRWQITLFSSRIGRYCGWLVAYTPKWFYSYAVRHRMYADGSRALDGTVEGYWRPNRDVTTMRHLTRAVGCWKRDFAALEPELAKIAANVPTTLLWGDRDVIVPIATAQKLRQAMGCGLIVIRGSGHLPYEEYPLEFNREVIRWGAMASTSQTARS